MKDTIRNYAIAVLNQDYIGIQMFGSRLKEVKPSYQQCREYLASVENLPRFGKVSQVSVATEILNLYR